LEGVDRITGYPVDLRSRKPKPMEYEDITEKITRRAHNVYNAMGFGFLESVYEKCLILELRHAGLKVEAQKVIPVRYKGESVGDFTIERKQKHDDSPRCRRFSAVQREGNRASLRGHGSGG